VINEKGGKEMSKEANRKNDLNEVKKLNEDANEREKKIKYFLLIF